MSENFETLQQEQLLVYARDLTKMHVAEKEKRKEIEIAHNKLKATLDSMKDGLATIDINLTIVEVNTTFTKIVGKPSEEIIGKSLRDCLNADGWEELHRGFDISDNTKELLLNPDKHRKQFFKIIISPIFDNTEHFNGFVLTFHDETQVERTNKLKEEFLGLISHEIRTPITAIVGFAEMLHLNLSEHMTEEDLGFLQILKNGTERLMRTVEELVDVSQFSETAVFQRDELSLHDLIDEAITQVEYKLADHNINIFFEKNELDCRIYGFRDLIVKALRHLLENAIEFSHDNSNIDVLIKESNDMYSLEIKDYGEGISHTQIDKMFDKFYQAEFYMSREHEGLGLGLAIVMKTALLHNGNIILESTLGEGTKAVLSLPKFLKPTSDQESDSEIELKKELSDLKKQTEYYARDLAKTFVEKRDTTHQLQRTKTQLLRSDKLAILGQMCATLSHEIRNSLTPIISNSELIPLIEPNLPQEVAQIVKKIKNRAMATADLLNQFLNFSKDSSVYLAVVDVIDRFEKTVDFFSFRFKKGKVTIEKKYHVIEAKIEANASQMDQVFSNLIINAMDAMSDKGVLTFEVDIKKVIDGSEDSFVEMRFSDTGAGIEKDIQETIFEPFFTTKAEGKGTGLGLFIVHQIIEQHGGTIEVESEPGKGTTFIIKMRTAR